MNRWQIHTLLRWNQRYDVGNERELSQVARKLGVGGGRDVLHVAQMWCLSLGPGTSPERLIGRAGLTRIVSGVLITVCSLPSANLRGDLIKIDDRAGRGFYTVQVKLVGTDISYNIVIDPDCSYVVRAIFAYLVSLRL